MAGGEWLVEEGIGETRALLYRHGEALAARQRWDGDLVAGTITTARLIERRAGSRRGLVRLPCGAEALIDHLPPNASEGAPITVEIRRGVLAEQGRLKRAQCRPSDLAPAPAPSLAQELAADGLPVRVLRRFPDSAWDEIIAEAASGHIPFAGGALVVSPTPAMTLIDVDGALPAGALALAAVGPIAAALARLDIAGNIGIDFPTLSDKPSRRALDEALAAALADWPHERTAINGFGFVQIVARLERMSLLARAARWPLGVAARQLLRRAEAVEAPGALLLVAPPALRAAISPAWEAALARRCGRAIRWQEEPGLAPLGAFAQACPA